MIGGFFAFIFIFIFIFLGQRICHDNLGLFMNKSLFVCTRKREGKEKKQLILLLIVLAEYR